MITVAGVSSFAKTEDLGVLGTGGATFGNSFSSFGGFTDYYTFQLGDAVAAAGGTVSYDSRWQDIALTAITLQTWTGVTWFNWSGYTTLGSDSTPSQFAFTGLGSGSYRLAVSGNIGLDYDRQNPNGRASYEGSIRSIASAAPEPGAFAMMLAGLVGVGVLAKRRSRGSAMTA